MIKRNDFYLRLCVSENRNLIVAIKMLKDCLIWIEVMKSYRI
jgi:hypothetical protein